MKRKLLVSVIALGMVLTGILTGCGSSSPSKSNNEKETPIENQETKETDETKEKDETTAAEEYDIGPDTYVSSFKYMITLPTINAGTRCAEVCGGTKGFYSMVAVQGIGEDDAELFNIDLTKNYSGEEIIEAVQPSVYSMLGDLHDTKDDYPSLRIYQDAAEFKYDDISSIEIGGYEFTKATGQIVVYPREDAEGAEPYYMNMVLYARKLTSGNLFYYFEYNDCNISVVGVDGPIELSIEDLVDNAEKNLKTFKEYEGDSYDLYQ